MKTIARVGRASIAVLLLALPAAQAQFVLATNNGATITIARYTDAGGDVAIPGTTNGLTVTCIGCDAFRDCTGVTSVAISGGVASIEAGAFRNCKALAGVTIPRSVTNIEADAFGGCRSLSAIAVDGVNAVYRSVDGVLFNKSQTTLIQCPGGKAGSYTIPDCVTCIGPAAFHGCGGLTRVTVPDGVTRIGETAFESCTALTSVYFDGKAPAIEGSNVFSGDDRATVYYLPGTAGWGASFGGRPVGPWVP